MPTRRVVIYSKQNCGLCEEARRVVENVRERVPFELSVVDITTLSHELLLRFRYDIPVISVDGVERFKHRVDEQAFEAFVRGTSVAETDPGSE
ncbi:MAG: glutaredoxin family protein [Myxococcaceae bacterium]